MMPLTATCADVREDKPYTTEYLCPICRGTMRTHLYVRTDITEGENTLCMAMTCTSHRCVFHTATIDGGVLYISEVPQMLRNMYAEIVQFMGEEHNEQ